MNGHSVDKRFDFYIVAEVRETKKKNGISNSELMNEGKIFGIGSPCFSDILLLTKLRRSKQY